MGKRILKEKTYEAFPIHGQSLQRLTGKWSRESQDAKCVWNFIDATQLSQQAAALKEIGKKLTNDVDTEPVLCLLIESYLKCPPKHQIKRAVASCLENVSHVNPYVEPALVGSIKEILLREESESIVWKRSTVDNLNSLLENFPLGERCLQNILPEALEFLTLSLETFYSLTRDVTTPVGLTEAMHHCHITVQVWNKLVSRAHTVSDIQPDRMVKATENLLPLLWNILMADTFLTDCRAACGMTLPLYLKVISPENNLRCAISDLFPEYDLEAMTYTPVSPASVFHHPGLTMETASAWPTARICVVGGCLAMLDTQLLTTQVTPNHSLIVDVIGTELLNLINKVYDTNSKVLLSRNLVLWTAKAISVLEQNMPEPPRWLAESLIGDAPVPSLVYDYAWNHWEDAIDVIRHQAKLIFDNLLQCHLLGSLEQSSRSEFFLGLFNSLISSGWQHQGRYGPLCCLVGHLGAGVILRRTPNLPQHLMDSVADQGLAGYVSELYEKMFTEHWHEVSLKLDPELDADKWFATWVDPLIHYLCHGSKLQKTHIIEYILPKLLKYNSDSLEYMTTRLTEDKSGVPTIGALVTCLKRAKMLGILRKDPELLTSSPAVQDREWHGVVSLPVLRQALSHQSEQIRLDAFGLLCENPKTTEVLPETDTDLIKFFLPLNMSSQSPAFRQHLTALLKKLYIRLKDGAQALRRKIKQGEATAIEDLQRYQDFVDWLVWTIFRNLYLGASFPRRTTALSSLLTFTNILAEGGCEFSLSHYMTSEREQTLLECLNDSFEQNKADAFHILASLPPQSLFLKCPARLSTLFSTALTLASSTRPQDCTTAAYLLRVLLTQPLLHEVATQAMADSDSAKSKTEAGGDNGGENTPNSTLKHGNPSTQNECKEVNAEERSLAEDVSATSKVSEKWERYLAVLEVLVEQLKQQLSVAHKSLIHAAATQPLYPIMHCIRSLLTDIDLKNLNKHHLWRPLVRELLTTSFQVALVVSPVVSNSSPEGNVPRGPGLELNAVVQEGEDPTLLSEVGESLTTVNLMPEYLVVCCWRSIKECSLLLGQLTMTAPLQDPDGDQQIGLLSVPQLLEIGDYFITQLLESRHRGAFELAYAGFVKMTERLWRCEIAEVHELPKRWLADIMADIRSHDSNNRLCSTRRSAGVPFYVQAIVSTEPTTAGRPCFRDLMSELLQLATPLHADPKLENTAQVHSLNVLRALYRDARLGEDVFPFIAEGLRAAILGYASQLWAIRNSATLLFSALMTRIFGVKRSKDEMSKKNCLTGRVFFHRFPSLFQFLLDQLEAATSNIGSGGVYQLHPGLYPVLMVLGRLYPSVVEGSNSTLNTTAFVPYVIRCASSPVYKTRIMAARAIRPLVGKDQISSTLVSMLQFLPTSSDSANSQNTIHGILLQMRELVESVGELPIIMASDVMFSIIDAAASRSWLISRENPCLLTRKAFAQLLVTIFSITTDLRIPPNPAMSKLEAFFTRESLSQLSHPPPDPSIPGLAEYMQCLASNLLHLSLSSCHKYTVKGSAKNAEKYGQFTTEMEQVTVGIYHKKVSSEREVGQLNYSKNMREDVELGTENMEALIIEFVVPLLASPTYEVRLETLEFLYNLAETCSPSSAPSSPSFSDSDRESEVFQLDEHLQELDESQIQTLLNNSTLFKAMVSMIMTESHLECLALILQVMSYSALTERLPWWDRSDSEYTHTQVMHRLNDCKLSTSDDVRCAAQALSSKIIPHLYKVASKATTSSTPCPELHLVRDWCNELEHKCATQESVYSRLSVAESLLHNTDHLLIDQASILGKLSASQSSVVMHPSSADVRSVPLFLRPGFMGFKC